MKADDHADIGASIGRGRRSGGSAVNRQPVCLAPIEQLTYGSIDGNAFPKKVMP